MNTHKSIRHTIKYGDEDMITDSVFGEDNTEYVITMSAKSWRDYDWVMDCQKDSAHRMVDYSHFVYLNHKDECTHAMVLAHSASLFVELRKKRRSTETTYIDPKFGTQGSA